MENQLKNSKEFKILYDWLQIARKPYQNISDDIQLLMELIDIPVTPEEIKFLANQLQSSSDKLQKDSFLNYFFVPEEKKKQAQKQLLTAFKFVANNEENITMDKLKQCLQQEGFDSKSADLVLNQVGDWQVDGKFDYKSFVAQHSQDK